MKAMSQSSAAYPSQQGGSLEGLIPASSRPRGGAFLPELVNVLLKNRHAARTFRKVAESVKRWPGPRGSGYDPRQSSRSIGSHAGRCRLTSAFTRGRPGQIPARLPRQPSAAAGDAQRWAGKVSGEMR